MHNKLITQLYNQGASLAPYIPESLRTLEFLIKATIKDLYRLSDDPNEDEPLSDYNPLVVETSHGEIVIIYLDEGKKNIYLFSTLSSKDSVYNLINRYSHKIPIIKDNKFIHDIPDTKLGAIVSASVISKHHEFNGWHSMSGISVEFQCGKTIYIGTELTELEIPGIWIIDPYELSQGWEITSLASSR
ncbi:hypothetical protein [Zooshikella ganghwensis]|uniref:hypothetical protein n=1 Tax=Zooshikella ganghwensis TaxID=202772 RepID=UPI000400C678|nr:hypothetical protein [Zooshikella ganghwensis]